MILWMKIRDQGYSRSYKSMCRALKRMQLKSEEKARQAYKPKPYEAAEYPGQKVQIDVKFVPGYCVADEMKYYQYTAIDEYSRLVYREMYDEHSTYSSREFIRKAIAFFPFKIELVQTDNGTEWTKALISNDPTPTLFEQELEKAGIKKRGSYINEFGLPRPDTMERSSVSTERTKSDSTRIYGCIAWKTDVSN